MNGIPGSLHFAAIERDAFGRAVDITAHAGNSPSANPAYRILAAVDGSRASLEALTVAARIADSHPGAALHILNAQNVIGAIDDHDALLTQGLDDTTDAREQLDTMGIPYTLRLVAGNPAAAILAHARDRGIAEIVMGAEGAGGVICALLGSVATDVVEKAGIPVTLVKSSSRTGQFPAGWVDWLVACDGSPPSLRALHHALQRSRSTSGTSCIHLLHVRVPDPRLPPPAQEATPLARHREQAVRDCAEALRLLDEAKADYRFHVDIGDPVARILEVAEDAGCGHIAMGTRGLGWTRTLIPGSISGGVLRRSPVPVTLLG